MMLVRVLSSRLLRSLALLGALAVGPVAAQAAQAVQQTNAMSIAAVVNEDIITVFDVQSRLGLYLATSGLDNTPETQQRLLPQVVNALIDERLQLQEAKRLKLTTTEAEVRQSIDGMEQRNGMQPGAIRAMLAEHGVDISTLNQQVEAQLAWIKVVRKDLSREGNVAPQEVQAVLAKMKANQGKPENLLAEIYLPVGPGASDQAVHQVAERLVQQARSGTPFPALAQQFSQSPTAALGGDLGWVVQGELEPELDAVASKMEPKDISDPIRTSTGYHILTLRDRRTSGAADPKMAVVTLSQIYLPNLGGRALPPAKIAQLSETIADQGKDCPTMNKLAKDFGGPGSGPIPAVYIGGLPEKVRDAIIDLKPKQLSKPIEVAGARLFVMVCTRKDDTGIPSEDAIMSQLQNEKLTNAARQKLRDLRRAALIDIRI